MQPWEGVVGMWGQCVWIGIKLGMDFRPLLWSVAYLVLAYGPHGLAGQETSGSLLDRPAGIEVDGVTLEAALDLLQRRSGVAIAFSQDVVPLDRTVSCDCVDATVGAALDVLLDGTGLEVRASRTQILIGRRSTMDSRRQIVGRVLEEEGGRAVPTAEIRVIGTDTGTLAGPDGGFVLRGVSVESVQLQVSAFGYETRLVTARASTPALVVELVHAPIPLNALIISPGSYGILEASAGATGVTVTRHDIEATPQIGDDVFRTLKRMPGVSTDDISTRLNVRGSTDRDLLVRLDGIELFEPYHLRDLDGALGIVDVQTLGGVDLITGGFPVEFGDKTAGVFDMRTRSAPSEGRRTTVGLSLSSVSLSSQGGFADGRGQWLTSLRRGFLEYILAATDVDDELNPRYWDALGRIQYLINDDHLLAAEVLLAGDQMGWTDDGTGSRIDSDWANGYGWLTWDATLSERLRSTTIASVGHLTRDRRGHASNPNSGAFTPLSARVNDVADFSFVGLRQDWQIDLNSGLMVKVGGEGRWADGSYDYRNSLSRLAVDADDRLFVQDDSLIVAAAPNGSEVGAYLALRGRLGSLTWEGGLRYDRWSYLDATALAPRLLARLDLNDRTNIRASVGRYHQSQGIHELDTPDGEVTFSAPETLDQLALGFERELGDGFTVRLDGYTKQIDNPRPRWTNLSREVNPLSEVESDRFKVVPDESRSRGVEAVLVRDGTSGVSWSASYALSKAEDRVEGRWAPRTLDQTHALNVRWAFDAGRNWQLSGSWQYHTGWPFTNQILDVLPVEAEDGTQTVNILQRGFGPLNDNRLPPYHRMDLRATRAFRFERSTLELFLDVFNVYDRTNLRGYEWFLEDQGGILRAVRDSGEEQLPRLPTVGLRWVF